MSDSWNLLNATEESLRNLTLNELNFTFGANEDKRQAICGPIGQRNENGMNSNSKPKTNSQSSQKSSQNSNSREGLNIRAQTGVTLSTTTAGIRVCNGFQSSVEIRPITKSSKEYDFSTPSETRNVCNIRFGINVGSNVGSIATNVLKPNNVGFETPSQRSTPVLGHNDWNAILPSVIGNKRERKTSLESTHNPISNSIIPLINACTSRPELEYGFSWVNSLLNDPIWAPQPPQPAPVPQNSMTEAIQTLRNVAKKREASYTWSGQLPRRVRTKCPIYSCKVFLGGIPYDLTDSDLHCTFAQFGHIQIQWPGKDIKSAIDGAAANKAGYVYIIFECYDNVSALLNACTISYRDVDSGYRWYYNISSRRQKGKEVQVIPFDIGDRFYMKGSFSGQMEHSRTVFVGALHGMLTADGLAKVMEDLFGGVIFAGLDTDKHKYPLGSGRVSFDNQDSYLKAVEAAFVEIKSARFKKKIQIDPYIENESLCSVCKVAQQAPIFCRDLTCFRYFCRNCWDVFHSEPETRNHRPIIKNKTI